MRGKQPKEREKYVIRLDDGALVEVNRAIYLEWYQSKRRERYQNEYSCAVKPHIRAGGNRQSGIQETVIASLLA